MDAGTRVNTPEGSGTVVERHFRLPIRGEQIWVSLDDDSLYSAPQLFETEDLEVIE